MKEHNSRPEALDGTLDQLSRITLPPEVEYKLRACAQDFYERFKSSKVTDAASPWISRNRWTCAATSLAAMVLLAAVFVFTGGGDARALVAKSLRKRPWVRMVLQIPASTRARTLPVAMPDESSVIWFSSQHKAIAAQMAQSSQYYNFDRGERWRYEAKDNTVYHEWPSSHEQSEFTYFNTLLRLIVDGEQGLPLTQSPIEFIERSQRDVFEGGRAWIEFTFHCRDPVRAPSEFTTTLRVDPESHLPSLMRDTYKANTGQAPIERTFVFDYPETGPADIYDLGVAHSAKVVERNRPKPAKELLSAHAEAQQRRIEPYSAIVLVALPQSNFSDVSHAFRVRFDGRTWRLERADLVELDVLRERVRSKQITPPKDDVGRWWKKEVAKLSFVFARETDSIPFGSAVFPDAVMYFMLADSSGPDADISLDDQPQCGPPGTILLEVHTQAANNKFWLDPKRDYAAIRWESVSGDTSWPISVQIVDKLEQSPSGRWYATQVRRGLVQKTGEEIRAELGLAPLAPSVSRFFVEFE